MGLFQRVAAAAAVACVLVPAAPTLGQQGLTDGQRFQALQQIIRAQGHRIDGTAADYRCSGRRGTAVITVISDQTGGVILEEQVGFYQGSPGWKSYGISTGNHTLYLRNEAELVGAGVSIKPTYAVIPDGQEEPILSPERSTPVALHYIQPFQRMTPEERLKGMEQAVRIACKSKSEEPSYPVIVQLLAPPTYQM